MRIVVKVGTSTLAYPGGGINIRRAESLCRVLSDLKNSGDEIILVTSGAIGMGLGKLGIRTRPSDMPTKQAAAAVGQCELMNVYDTMFTTYNHIAAQLLITGSIVQDENSLMNFKNTMNRLLELKALPIINENDTVETAEIAIGDNDTLAAIVSSIIEADLLVLLSDIDGLFTADPKKDPNARIIPVVNEITPEIEELAGGAGSTLGTGGMQTKIRAARICGEAGCDMIIANGRDPEILYALQDGREFGTRFIGKR